MDTLGWHASIPLRDGIDTTYRWFEASDWASGQQQ
jgi:nucleoside-diphosphate-sugar epimerase